MVLPIPSQNYENSKTESTLIPLGGLLTRSEKAFNFIIPIYQTLKFISQKIVLKFWLD